jgi:amino acid permease
MLKWPLGQTSTTEIQTPNSSAQPLPKGKASLGSAVFNITNTIIGGGIVALPFVVKSVGIITAFVLFVVLAVMVAYSALILVKSSLFVFKGPKTYQDLAYKAFGKVGPLLVEIVADLYLLGAMTGYTIIVGDVLTESIYELFNWSVDYKIVTLVVTLIVFYPLSALKSIHSLRITSFLAIVGIVFLLVCVFLRAFQFISSNGFSSQLKLVDSNIQNVFEAIPIILFAYVFHPSVFPVWSEMKDKGKFGISAAIYVSIIIGGLIYISVGIFAYLTFYDQTQGNILLNYIGDPLMFIAKLGYTAVVAFSYPIMSYPLRYTSFRCPACWNECRTVITMNDLVSLLGSESTN